MGIFISLSMAVAAIFFKNKPINLIALLFFHGVIFFLPSIIFLTGSNFSASINLVHLYGYSSEAVLTGVFFLFLILFMLSKISIQYVIKMRPFDFLILGSISIAAVVSIAGYLVGSKIINRNTLESLIATEAMFYLTAIGYLAILKERIEYRVFRKYLIGFLIVLVSFSLAIELVEIILNKTWASTIQYDGVIVKRASGLLFNPNLMAFFLSLAILYIAYEYQRNKKSYIFITLIVAFSAFYLTGSRSSSYLLFFILLGQFITIRSSSQFTILLLMPFTYLSLWIIGNILSIFDFSFSENIISLGNRLGMGFIYGFLKIYSMIDMNVNQTLMYIPPEISTSVNGRFYGDGKDSGILLLRDDAGYFGLFSVGLYYVLAFYLFIISWIKSRSITLLYAFSALLFCTASNFLMKFQIYPVWIFISVIYIIFLYNCRALFITND